MSLSVRCGAHFKDGKATVFPARIVYVARLTATLSKAEAPVKSKKILRSKHGTDPFAPLVASTASLQNAALLAYVFLFNAC